ncbi:MAG: DUF4372 domain-containing protein [Treponema sp.]|jgi:hypothetical protein|nr:DUF4372 domain-containing protein [Treponema sp.]
MTKYTTVFAGLLRHLSRSDFEKAVKSHQADKEVRTLSTFDWKAMVHTPELVPEICNTLECCKTIFVSGYGPSPVQ